LTWHLEILIASPRAVCVDFNCVKKQKHSNLRCHAYQVREQCVSVECDSVITSIICMQTGSSAF